MVFQFDVDFPARNDACFLNLTVFLLEVAVYHATLRVEFTDLHDVVYICFFALVGNGVELFGKGLEFEIGNDELCHDNLRQGELSVGRLGLSLLTSVLYLRKRRISIQHHNSVILTLFGGSKSVSLYLLSWLCIFIENNCACSLKPLTYMSTLFHVWIFFYLTIYIVVDFCINTA